MEQTNLMKNSIFSMLNKGINILYPLIVSAYISRILLSNGVGQISFAINIVTYFTLAAGLGIPKYAINTLAKMREKPEEFQSTLEQLTKILLISSVAVSIIYYAFILIFYRNNELFSVYLILGVIVISNAINYDWYFDATEKFKYIAIRNFLIKTIAVIVMFFIVKTQNDLLQYSAIYSFTLVAPNVCNYLYVRKNCKLHFFNVPIGVHIKPIMILFAATIATEIYTLIDSTMLGIMCEPNYLGYYSNATKVVRAAYGIVLAIVAVFNPRMSYFYGNNNQSSYLETYKKSYNISMIFSIPLSVGIFLLADQIVLFMFGEDFVLAGNTLKILSILPVVFSFATTFGHVPLVIYKKEKSILIATIIGAVVNLILNSFMIKIWQQNGAAIASCISEVIVASIMTIVSLKVIKIKLFNKSFIQSIVSSVLMGCVVFVFNKFLPRNLMMLLVTIIVAVIVYFLAMIILGNDIVKSIIAILFKQKRKTNSDLK